MTSFDPHRNFVYSTVGTAPSPASSGTTVTVAAGDGALFPDPASVGAYNVVVCSAATATAAEVCRVTAKSSDRLTWTRAQESSSARSVSVGDAIFMAITAKSFTDLESAINATYTTYTPTWASSGNTQPVIGNGSLTGRYIQIGKHIHFHITVTPGSSSSFGTGTYTFGLPVTASGSVSSNMPVGQVYAIDASTGSVVQAQAIYSSGTSVNVQYPATWPTGAQTIFAQTVPWTWAQSDVIRISGQYEST